MEEFLNILKEAADKTREPHFAAGTVLANDLIQAFVDKPELTVNKCTHTIGAALMDKSMPIEVLCHPAIFRLMIALSECARQAAELKRATTNKEQTITE